MSLCVMCVKICHKVKSAIFTSEMLFSRKCFVMLNTDPSYMHLSTVLTVQYT